MPFATLCLTPVAVRLAPLWPCLQGKTVKAVTLLSLKRTHDLFVGNHGQKVPLDEEAQKAKIACKVGNRSSWAAGLPTPHTECMSAEAAPPCIL